MRSTSADGRISTRLAAVLAVVALLGTLVATAQAAKPVAVTFVDYAQCANGAPPSAALDCPDGWINGILQASNSHYAEDQVTPQRAEVLVPSGAALSHTVTFVYQTRKGSAETHAYDSLATWNYTQTAADRNQGLNPNDQVGGAAMTAQIPADPTVLAPFSSASGATSDHDLPDADRQFTAYGLPAGSTLSVSVPVHDCSIAIPSFCDDPTKDDYASVTVTYTLPDTASARKVQFLFGGHLALGSSGGSRTWGLGNGASDISGGPYHIKWTASDGASIGNRDNQIMGSAIIFNDTGLSTTPNPSSGTVPLLLNDSANLTGATATAGGTITFKLYPPGDQTCTGTASYTDTVTVSGPGTYSTSPGFTATTAGTWNWTADYSGDANNAESHSGCGAEAVTVSPATPALTTTASGTVTVGQDIYDVAHLSASYNATGAITFDLYGPDDATCATSIATLNATPATDGDGDYTSESYTTSAAGTYRWIAHFAGDANNVATDTACNDANESVVVSPATPSAATTPDVQTRDNVTLSGGFGAITGTVDFALYDNVSCSGTAVFTQDNVALVGAQATSDWTSITTSDTYYWQVHYDGNANNAAFTSACGEATTITLP